MALSLMWLYSFTILKLYKIQLQTKRVRVYSGSEIAVPFFSIFALNNRIVFRNMKFIPWAIVHACIYIVYNNTITLEANTEINARFTLHISSFLLFVYYN